jgi:hypothetical protein
MSANDEPQELSDQKTLAILDGLLHFNRVFRQVCERGMLIGRTDEERRYAEELRQEFQSAAPPSGEEEPTPLTEPEKVKVAELLIVRFNRFKRAYEQGIIVARDEEQQAIVDELAEQWGPVSG